MTVPTPADLPIQPVPVAIIEQAYREACLGELAALKPGNVHIFADGHGMVVQDFLKSAEVSAHPLCEPSATVGERILKAVNATWDCVACNTNLGIVLLAAPLIHAVSQHGKPFTPEALRQTLESLTIEDAVLAYQAIERASPAGLGSSDMHDVHDRPAITLLQAMQVAEGRDLVARQYANGYADILATGIPAYQSALQAWDNPAWATTAVYLAFLAHFPDSHIARKYGWAKAEAIRAEAAQYHAELLAQANPKRYQRSLLDYDAQLKAQGINPGTSADLTVATLLVSALMAP